MQGGKSEKIRPNEQIFMKNTQYAFSSKLKQQKCHKIWKKSNRQKRNLQKPSPKNKQSKINTESRRTIYSYFDFGLKKQQFSVALPTP